MIHECDQVLQKMPVSKNHESSSSLDQPVRCERRSVVKVRSADLPAVVCMQSFSTRTLKSNKKHNSRLGLCWLAVSVTLRLAKARTAFLLLVPYAPVPADPNARATLRLPVKLPSFEVAPVRLFRGPAPPAPPGRFGMDRGSELSFCRGEAAPDRGDEAPDRGDEAPLGRPDTADVSRGRPLNPGRSAKVGRAWKKRMEMSAERRKQCIFAVLNVLKECEGWK